MIASQFESGATFYVVGSGDEIVPLTMSALFKKMNREDVFGLANQNEKLLGCKDAVYADRAKNDQVGTLSTSDVFPHGDNLGELFNVIKFNKNAVQPIRYRLTNLAFTKDVSKHMWRPRPMRIRKTVVGQRGLKTHSVRTNYKGLLIGDVINPAIGLRDNHIVTIRRAARAQSSGEKPIASEADGGAIVLSKSKALFGFVVGSADHELLIMSAEDLLKDYEIQFIAPRSTENLVRLAPPGS